MRASFQTRSARSKAPIPALTHRFVPCDVRRAVYGRSVRPRHSDRARLPVHRLAVANPKAKRRPPGSCRHNRLARRRTGISLRRQQHSGRQSARRPSPGRRPLVDQAEHSPSHRDLRRRLGDARERPRCQHGVHASQIQIARMTRLAKLPHPIAVPSHQLLDRQTRFLRNRASRKTAFRPFKHVRPVAIERMVTGIVQQPRRCFRRLGEFAQMRAKRRWLNAASNCRARQAVIAEQG